MSLLYPLVVLFSNLIQTNLIMRVFEFFVLCFCSYIIPMTVAALSLILRWFADNTCSSWSQTCKASSDALSHLYQVVFFFLLIIAATKMKQMQTFWSRLKNALDALLGATPQSSKKKD